MENEFPPNSNSPRRERPSEKAVKPRKEVAQVTRGKVTLRKKPLYKKFIEAFKPDDGTGFVEYTLLEVLVPGLKGAIADGATSTIEHALGVDRVSRRRRGGGYTSYNRMSEARPRSRRDRDDHRRAPSRRSSDIPEVILESRVEGEEILDTMIEIMSKYDAVTMRDLLGMIGEPHNTTDEDWGWTDLRGARIHRVSGGYLLDLPRPEDLD